VQAAANAPWLWKSETKTLQTIAIAMDARNDFMA
jgi:hypothetical protein